MPGFLGCYDARVVSRKGKFITIEGLDGCGKSTQLGKLGDYLRGEGLDVLVTREPGGTPIGDRIRALLLDSSTAGLSPLTEMALMFAARSQHLQEVILPALHQGKIVLCDRFTDSTEAYQGGGRKLGSEPVLELHRVLCGNIRPDLTLLMDSDVSVSVARARRRNRDRRGGTEPDENRFEQESRAFFHRVRDAYLSIARREPERVMVIDGRGTPEATHQAMVRAVEPRLKLRARTG
jgi:dTMP kinase